MSLVVGYGATVSQLEVASGFQLSKASLGVGLESPAAADPPEYMKEAPTNVVGAAYRNAYWLAVASRVADHRGNKTAAWNLYGAAIKYKSQARLGFFSGARAVLGLGIRPKAIQNMLDEGADTAENNGQHDIAGILRGLGTLELIEDQQAVEGTAGFLDSFIPKPLRQIGVTTYVVFGLLALGVTGYLVFRKQTRKNSQTLPGWHARSRRKRKNPAKLSVGNRLGRVVGGTLLAAGGAVGWFGPQAAEPVSTVLGGALSLAGASLIISGLAGQTGVLSEAVTEAKEAIL